MLRRLLVALLFIGGVGGSAFLGVTQTAAGGPPTRSINWGGNYTNATAPFPPPFLPPLTGFGDFVTTGGNAQGRDTDGNGLPDSWRGQGEVHDHTSGARIHIEVTCGGDIPPVGTGHVYLIGTADVSIGGGPTVTRNFFGIYHDAAPDDRILELEGNLSGVFIGPMPGTPGGPACTGSFAVDVGAVFGALPPPLVDFATWTGAGAANTLKGQVQVR